MKKASLKFFAGAGLVLGLLAFTTPRVGMITGSVTPSEGAREVVALEQNSTDTLRAEFTNGTFAFRNVPKGKYTVWIKTIPPYRADAIQDVVVDTATINLGEIKLLQ